MKAREATPSLLLSLFCLAVAGAATDGSSSCKAGQESGQVVCSNVPDPEQLKRDLQDLAPKMLELVDSGLSCLPPMGEDMASVQSLRITNTRLPFLAPPGLDQSDAGHKPFIQSLSKLRLLELRGVAYLHAWDWTAASVRSLTTLSVNGCRMVDLPPSFASLSRLRKLVIESSELRWVPALVFRGLRALTEVSLSRNKIRKIESGLFTGCPGLAKLDLSHNWIESLPLELFVVEARLSALDLSGNPLTHLDHRTFQHTQFETKVVFLENTSLPCDCSYVWLRLENALSPTRAHCTSRHKINFFQFLESCKAPEGESRLSS